MVPTSRVDSPGIEAVVIGGSAGAVVALGEILPGLPRECPPVLVVVHVPPSSPTLLPSIFSGRCAMRVRDPEPQERLERGTLYFAPPGYHLLIERDRRCALSVGPPVHYSRPSIDVLFESAAWAFGATLVGLVLTGANADGAAGLRAVHRAGGVALVQAPASAEIDVMPLAALAAVPTAHVVTLSSLTRVLRSYCGAE